MSNSAQTRRTVLTTGLAVASLLLICWATLTPRGGQIVGLNALRFCLWCGNARVTDALANMVLFVPLGFAAVLGGMSLRAACVASVCLTLGIETLQYIGLPAGRVASVSDVITNAVGGAVGASLAQWRHTIMYPRRSIAALLAGTWTLMCAGVFLATAWAVSAPSHDVAAIDATVPIRRSALPFAPGFGWYEGTVAGARVNGVELSHRGTGPVIVEAPRLDRYIAHVTVTGRDHRRGIVPMLYVHGRQSEAPLLVLAQRGSSMLLRVGSRAGNLGLAPLDLSVPGAFAPGTMLPTDTSRITARVTGRELSLVVSRGPQRWSGVQLRTATVGWALVQSLIPVSSPGSAVLTGTWLVLLLLPLGYWGWWSRTGRAYVILAGSIVVATALASAGRLFEIASPPPWQWCLGAGGVALGMLVGRLTWAYGHGPRARHD